MANKWVNLLVDVARAVISSVGSRSGGAGSGSGGSGGPTTTAARPQSRPARGASAGAPVSGGGRATASDTYPGDYRGAVTPTYSPDLDGAPDPGEIVWTWVPYEEDHTQGKDRPVLLVGHDGPWLLALQLTSKDHDRDHAQEARAGRYWMDIGTGAWDKQGRPSELRLNRVIRVAPDAVRREGAVLPKALFSQVVAEMQRIQG